MAAVTKPSRHRSATSQETNGSGLADSTMTFGTVESVQLSQFPSPPSEVPVTPIQSSFGTSSPSRSSFTVTPPATPTRRQGTPFYSGPLSSTTPLVPQRKASTSTDQGPASSSQGPPPLPTAPYRALNNGIQRRGGSPPPYFPSPLAHAVSPHDWHEGASSIDVDATEDRLLSTSFITSLLSSMETASQKRLPHSTPGHSNGGNRTSFSAFSGMSASSELTFPPPSRDATPSRAYHRYPPQAPTTTQQATTTRTHGRGPPPTAYTPVEEDDGGTTISSRTSVDSATLLPAGDNDPSSIIRTQSDTQTSGVRGTSAVGVVQAKLHGIPGSRLHHPTDVNLHSKNEGVVVRVSLENTVGAEKLGVADYHVSSSSMSYGPATPPTVMHSRFLRENSRHETRQSMHSTKTARSHVPSFMSSARSIRQTFRSLWVKPLPPVPMISETMASRITEAEMPLPELVSRADTLSHMLDKGHHPHRSLNSYVTDGERSELNGNGTGSTPTFAGTSTGTVVDLNTRATGIWHSPHDHIRQRAGGTSEDSLIRPPKPTKQPSSKMKALLVIAVCTAVAVIVGIVVGLTKRKASKAPACSGNFTGSACNLDATCICTSSLSGQCNGLAHNLVALIPSVNSLFDMNYTATSLATAIWEAQGAPTGINCAVQSILVDVAPALDSGKWPNRTEWAQSALLWNLVQSQDLAAVAKMRSFVVNAAWHKLGDGDGPISDISSTFSMASTGFVFDFATQTVIQPNATFLDKGQPTRAQIAQVGSTAQSALDRMYSYAVASSTQRQKALSTYWRSTLHQNPADLPVFMSAISATPILVPFDATSSKVASLLTTSTSAPFPPPLACYPGLNSTQIQRVNTIETSVFGLPSVSAATQFDTSCFSGRPLYGVLDILRLRLPFIDSRTGVAKQAAVLTRDVGPRAVVYSGEILSAFPSASDAPNITATQANNPRQYGTLNNLNHVILNYFSAIPDINVATALVKYVLSSPAVPPTNTSILLQCLASIPVLEVGIFGTINPSDISSSMSSFTSPSGALFFGSDQATLLRNWTLTGTGTSVVWTEFSSSPEVVRDNSYNSTVFNDVWNAVSTFLHTSNPGVTVGVSNITQSFHDTNSFNP